MQSSYNASAQLNASSIHSQFASSQIHSHGSDGQDTVPVTVGANVVSTRSIVVGVSTTGVNIGLINVLSVSDSVSGTTRIGT